MTTKTNPTPRGKPTEPRPTGRNNFEFPSRPVYAAVLAGILLTASFPPVEMVWLVWFALVPLLMSLENRSFAAAFRLGFITGLSHYLTLIYWIVFVLGHYGNLSIPLSIGPLLLLCAYLAVYPAFFAGLTVFLPGAPFKGLLIGVLWVALEYVRSNLLTGFPWCLLGYSLFESQPLIQIADITGVYGLSFLIVIINGLLYSFLGYLRTRSVKFLKWQILTSVLALAVALGYGRYRLAIDAGPANAKHPLKVALVQANIDQSVKWNPGYQDRTMEVYAKLSRSARSFKPDLTVWPETALPFFFQDDQARAENLRALAKELESPLIFGSPGYKKETSATSYYNRAYLLTPDKRVDQYYDKVHLVPFGEYVPLKKWLFFIDRLVTAAGDFVPGKSIAPLKQDSVVAGILICFEAIFPELARNHTKAGANVLVNLTNDAWFGRTGAPYQHLSMAVFRAVENRRPLLRAANTGFTAVISPHGRIREKTALFSEDVLQATVDISRTRQTFYTRWGDVFALVASAVALLWVLTGIRRRSKS